MQNRKFKLPTFKVARNAASDNIEQEIRSIRKRGWLRPNLIVNPTDYVREALLQAVDRGRQETDLVHSQAGNLAKWKRHTDRALRAAKSLTILKTALPIADLWTLAAKEDLFRSASKNMSEARVFDAALADALEKIERIARGSKRFSEGIADHKKNPGNPFVRGFLLEMMKTWWLLTGRIPSTKRSFVNNPFVAFADAVLQSVWATIPDHFSCAGAVRSVLPEFQHLRCKGVFDSVLIELTGGSQIDNQTKPPNGSRKKVTNPPKKKKRV